MASLEFSVARSLHITLRAWENIGGVGLRGRFSPQEAGRDARPTEKILTL